MSDRSPILELVSDREIVAIEIERDSASFGVEIGCAGQPPRIKQELAFVTQPAFDYLDLVG